MRAVDKLKSSPVDIEATSISEEKRKQTVKALSESFRNSVKLKGQPGDNLETTIQKMSVKDINDIFFDDPVPHVLGKGYYAIIEDFLSDPRFYKDDLDLIVEGYLSTVSDLQKQVQTLLTSGQTHDHDENYRTSTASYLDTRLTSVCERTKIVAYVYETVDNLQKQFSNMELSVIETGKCVNSFNITLGKLSQTVYGQSDKDGRKTLGIEDEIHQLSEIIDGKEKDDGVKIPGIKETVDQLSEKIKGIGAESDKIMPNIISLLGVFSSIIVVILSLITTSSTWLSNADNISVLIAFVIPAGIITISICALTALIRAMIEGQQGESSKRPKWGVWILVVTVTLLIVCGTIWFCQEKSSNQTHYLIKCLPTSATEADSNDETQSPADAPDQELYIIQEVVLPTGELYPKVIPCDNSHIRSDGYVYYCILHQQFE